MTSASKGFTLIELLVVIAIIAVLSLVGIVTFTSVQKGARDSKRRADIDAIAKAYEIKKSNSYVALSDSDFSSGKKPLDPTNTKGDYFNWLPQDGSGFKVCASLDNNPSSVCNTPATNCYCKVSSQGTLNPSSPVNEGGSTQYSYGLGGSSSQSCDPNGTLLSGLVGYWKMDEGSGATTVDSSGNGNNGTANGPTRVGGKLGIQALSFDGSDDYVEVPYSNSLSTANGFTVTGWVNIVGNGQQGYNGLIFHAGGYDTDNRILINNGGSVLTQFSIGAPYPAGYSSLSTVSGLVPTGVWTLITYTYDGAIETIYVNNESKATNSKTGGIYGGTSPIKIGWGHATDVYTMSGLIDDVRIYNRALSGTEVSNLYNGGSGCVY